MATELQRLHVYLPREEVELLDRYLLGSTHRMSRSGILAALLKLYIKSHIRPRLARQQYADPATDLPVATRIASLSMVELQAAGHE